METLFTTGLSRLFLDPANSRTAAAQPLLESPEHRSQFRDSEPTHEYQGDLLSIAHSLCLKATVRETLWGLMLLQPKGLQPERPGDQHGDLGPGGGRIQRARMDEKSKLA